MSVIVEGRIRPLITDKPASAAYTEQIDILGDKHGNIHPIAGG